MRNIFYHRLQNMDHAPGLNGDVVALCNPQTANPFLLYLEDMTPYQFKEEREGQEEFHDRKRNRLWQLIGARNAYEAEFGEVDAFKPSYAEGFRLWSRRQRLEDWE